jgi:hypothetical protein
MYIFLYQANDRVWAPERRRSSNLSRASDKLKRQNSVAFVEHEGGQVIANCKNVYRFANKITKCFWYYSADARSTSRP